MSSIQTITNAKNGTTRSIYSVESIQQIPFNEEYEPKFNEQEKIILEGLAIKFKIADDVAQMEIEKLVHTFCVLADRPHKKTHSTGRVKKTDTVESAKSGLCISTDESRSQTAKGQFGISTHSKTLVKRLKKLIARQSHSMSRDIR